MNPLNNNTLMDILNNSNIPEDQKAALVLEIEQWIEDQKIKDQKDEDVYEGSPLTDPYPDQEEKMKSQYTEWGI